MVKRIKAHVKSNGGDMYIQMLICMVCLLGLLAFAFQITATLTQKIWVDDQLNDITRIIAVTGDVDNEDVEEIILRITDKMGGRIEITPAEWFDEGEKLVQLGTTVKVKYLNDAFPVIKLGDFTVDIEVDLSRQGISEVYFKPTNYS